MRTPYKEIIIGLKSLFRSLQGIVSGISIISAALGYFGAELNIPPIIRPYLMSFGLVIPIVFISIAIVQGANIVLSSRKPGVIDTWAFSEAERKQARTIRIGTIILAIALIITMFAVTWPKQKKEIGILVAQFDDTSFTQALLSSINLEFRYAADSVKVKPIKRIIPGFTTDAEFEDIFKAEMFKRGLLVFGQVKENQGRDNVFECHLYYYNLSDKKTDSIRHLREPTFKTMSFGCQGDSVTKIVQGFLYYMLNNYQASVAQLSKVGQMSRSNFKSDTDYSNFKWMIGNAYFKVGHADKALACYFEAQKLNQKEAAITYNMGYAALAANDIANASKFFIAANSKNSNLTVPMFEIGERIVDLNMYPRNIDASSAPDNGEKRHAEQKRYEEIYTVYIHTYSMDSLKLLTTNFKNDSISRRYISSYTKISHPIKPIAEIFDKPISISQIASQITFYNDTLNTYILTKSNDLFRKDLNGKIFLISNNAMKDHVLRDAQGNKWALLDDGTILSSEMRAGIFYNKKIIKEATW